MPLKIQIKIKRKAIKNILIKNYFNRQRYRKVLKKLFNSILKILTILR